MAEGQGTEDIGLRGRSESKKKKVEGAGGWAVMSAARVLVRSLEEGRGS